MRKPNTKLAHFSYFFFKWQQIVYWYSQMVRETGVQSHVASYQKTLKMVLDTSLLNTRQYKVRIEGKMEKSRERSSALPYSSV